MDPSASAHTRIAPSAATASLVRALLVYECTQDVPGVSIPRPETHLVFRFGPSARGGLDAHVFGARQKVHRKLLRRGQRTVTVRLGLGAHEAVLGVPASNIAGRVTALDDLWGDALTRRLLDRLSGARTVVDAAAILECAISERLARTDQFRTPAPLALQAADRIATAKVHAVAIDLGVSERHLRRVFHETVGVSPKVFARLTRFHHALHAARDRGHSSWANIAATSGYYDQAHLIAEFRAISGVTPQALVGELREAASIG